MADGTVTGVGDEHAVEAGGDNPPANDALGTDTETDDDRDSDDTETDDDRDSDDTEGHGYEPPTELIASGFEAWRRRTASGAILSAVAMGLAQVFNLDHKKPAIIAEAPGDPYDEDDPVQVDYVPDDAEATRVRVRPWLFGDDNESEA